jgi:hypothetical protein
MQCKTCSKGKEVCDECDGNREDPTICDCPAGTFDMGEIWCEPCECPCETCLDLGTCLSCCEVDNVLPACDPPIPKA